MSAAFTTPASIFSYRPSAAPRQSQALPGWMMSHSALLLWTCAFSMASWLVALTCLIWMPVAAVNGS
jgi:thiosulfate reductase cytochrome b subunit